MLGLTKLRNIGQKFIIYPPLPRFVLFAMLKLFRVSTTSSIIVAHLNAARNKLFSSIGVALGPASPACSSFFDAPDSIKTKVLLGAPSDDLNIDRRVDIAFRKFLLRVDACALRRSRHIAVSYILDIVSRTIA